MYPDWSSLSLAELYGQLAVSWLDLVQLLFVLVAYGVIEPGCLVIFIVTSGGRTPISDRLEAFVKEVGVFVVLGRLFGDFGEGARLRDVDQLPVCDQRYVLLKMQNV